MTTPVRAEFSAPWSRSLRTATALCVTLLVLLVLVGLFTGPRQLPVWRVFMIGVPVLLLLGAPPFMVRGYQLTDTDIRVRRLGWSTVLPLAGITSITGEPAGLRGSVRLFGIGGLFAICGWFWNRRFGTYRAYATDPDRVVLVRYRDGRNIVLTPGDVQHFIVRARTAAHLASA